MEDIELIVITGRGLSGGRTYGKLSPVKHWKHELVNCNKKLGRSCTYTEAGPRYEMLICKPDPAPKGKTKAGYGEYLLKELSVRLTSEFGKGFDYSNIKNMRQFYVTFPIGDALRSQLSWTHYRLLMRVKKEVTSYGVSYGLWGQVLLLELDP